MTTDRDLAGTRITPTKEDWIAEIERRARAAAAGEPGVSWEETRATIERRLADK